MLAVQISAADDAVTVQGILSSLSVIDLDFWFPPEVEPLQRAVCRAILGPSVLALV